MPVPSVPIGLTQADFGQRVMLWGTGDAAAISRVASLTRDELVKYAVTLEMAQAWQSFYEDEARRNPRNPSAKGRAALMRRAAELLGG